MSERLEQEQTERGQAAEKKQSVGKALWQYKWLYFWIVFAFAFDVGIYYVEGWEKAVDFAGGYLIELSLSVDNLFVFLLIFISFGIKEHAQHKVLAYGIAGTIVLRFLFLFVGITLVNRFEWVLWVFGTLLIFSGAKMFKPEDEDKDPRDGILYKMIAKFLPMSNKFEGERFIVDNDGTNFDPSNPLSKRAKKLCTPLAVVMVLLIFSDVIFAIDSVPAVISMTRDMFIVYTSNTFAILGLRQLFFVLEHMHRRFMYVKYGVAFILIFTGVKMLLGIFDIHIHNLVSIAIIMAVLIVSIIISSIVSKWQERSDQFDHAERRKEIEDAFDKADERKRRRAARRAAKKANREK